jgi:hypothetical protein
VGFATDGTLWLDLAMVAVAVVTRIVVRLMQAILAVGSLGHPVAQM